MDKNQFKFFLVVLPGLEDLAALELNIKSKLYEQELLNIKAINGGIEFSCNDITTGLYVNHYTKIGTRLLLRIDEFKVRDFPKLFNKLKKINWNQYISGSTPELSFQSKDSKIFDERKVKKCLEDAMKAFFHASPPKKKYVESPWQYKTSVYMRFVDDLCTLSIDTSGERIDKRGQKTFSTKAPIRESIAAAMYLYNKDSIEKHGLTDILDPMSGSGTLLFEHEGFFSLNYDRYFLYQDFPKVQIKKIRFEHESKIKLFARDLEQKNISTIEANAEKAEIKIDTKCIDLFKNDENYSDKLVVINPPYNKRIKTNKNIHVFLKEMLDTVTKNNEAKNITLVMPETFKIDLPKKEFKISASKRISNGGIWVKFFSITRK